jgi:hypothetical protein
MTDTADALTVGGTQSTNANSLKNRRRLPSLRTSSIARVHVGTRRLLTHGTTTSTYIWTV